MLRSYSESLVISVYINIDLSCKCNCYVDAYIKNQYRDAKKGVILLRLLMLILQGHIQIHDYRV
jgi:hypothetical protein